ncbi:MAG: hypothetical protein ABSH17_08110 [Syntrophobacteraceae bacterium]|jgi:hypothetical protein
MNRSDRIKEYLERLRNLYDSVLPWCQKQGLNVTQEEAKLVEENLGAYTAPALIITASGSIIANLKPIGTNIIGASGRVDIIGSLDKDSLVYLEVGGPSIKTSVSTGGKVIEQSSKPFFKGVTREGWYWIEERRLGRARIFDEQLFLDLLTEVSDYVTS